MCNLYHVSPKGDAERYIGEAAYQIELPDYDMTHVGPFDQGVFIRAHGPRILGFVGRWGLIAPFMRTRKQVDGQKNLTNNARFETIGDKPSYSLAWKRGQRCLIPAQWLREPNWETGRNIWWNLRRADGLPWMVAGIWADWTDPETGEVLPSFAMVTFNVDSHPLLRRLHKPVVDPVTKIQLPPELQDKRGEAHIRPADWHTWLQGSEEDAVRLLVPPPVEAFDMSDAAMTDQALASASAPVGPDERPEPPPQLELL
ncbi:SOS response-associated peptidase [Roseateles sp. P5_E7]